MMKKTVYENWAIHPDVVDLGKVAKLSTAIWKRKTTKHEGDVLYFKLWNFWVRAGVEADLRSHLFFRDYEKTNTNADALMANVGFSWKKTETEEEVWQRIGMVWKWLQNNVQVDNSAYAGISSVTGSWPSILDYAGYFATHGKLVWAACFSKAHLFATLLGRMIYPRYRFAIAETHHSEGGAPPTATHVYVAVYAAERWFYLDPTAIHKNFPDFHHKESIGVKSFVTVDYQHPYKIIPVPLSGFEYVPWLST